MSTFSTYEILSHNFLTPSLPLLQDKKTLTIMKVISVFHTFTYLSRDLRPTAAHFCKNLVTGTINI